MKHRFVIFLIVIPFLILIGREIKIMIKSKIKRLDTLTLTPVTVSLWDDE